MNRPPDPNKARAFELRAANTPGFLERGWQRSQALRVLPERSEPDPTQTSVDLWEAAYLRFETPLEETRKPSQMQKPPLKP